MARLDPHYAAFVKESDRLVALLGSISRIDAVQHRKLIAEIVLLRLSSLLETHLELVFAKLTCGASYLDGSRPSLIVSTRSVKAALHAMESLNRPKFRNPIWNDGAKIRENVAHLIAPTDHCMRTMVTYAPDLTEIRYVRNHIAHRNAGTRKRYQTIVRKFYGAFLPAITCGTLLLSERVSRPSLLEVYIRTARVLLKDLVKA